LAWGGDGWMDGIILVFVRRSISEEDDIFHRYLLSLEYVDLDGREDCI
jgi:hypothetical protein